MKEINVVEPIFATEFKCVGSACRDHCCKEWEITLDKPTVNQYLKSSVIEIRNIAVNSIEITKKSHDKWAKMKLNDSKTCSFMDSDKLCKIHSTLGSTALSHTCSTYPRTSNSFKAEVNNTLMLSCPEAARLLLSSSEAMLLDNKVIIQNKYNNCRAIGQWDKLLNVMSMHLIKVSGLNVNQGLYAIAALMIFSENENNKGNSEILEKYFFSLVDSIENGLIAANVDSLNNDAQLQWSLLLRLQVYIETRKPTRGIQILRMFVKRLLHIQTHEISSNSVDLPIERLEKAWSTIVMPWLEKRPYIFNNYMLYRINTEQFPDSISRTPLSWLYLLTAEWFLLKSLISATAELKGEINEDDFVDIIYSFHSVTKHSKIVTDAFFAEIEKVKVNDDISLLYLLK
jgi:lysine-N-methylase